MWVKAGTPLFERGVDVGRGIHGIGCRDTPGWQIVEFVMCSKCFCGGPFFFVQSVISPVTCTSFTAFTPARVYRLKLGDILAKETYATHILQNIYDNMK